MALTRTRQRMAPEIRLELILDEALRLFAERHFSVVTVRDIAVACNINVALIYHYFESKEHLTNRVLAHAIEQLQSYYTDGSYVGDDPAKQLFQFLKLHEPIAPMVKRLVKIMSDYSAFNERDPASDRLIKDFYKREQVELEDCLRRGVKLGVFEAMNVQLMARFISLQLDGIFYASSARGDDRITKDINDLCQIVETLTRKNKGKKAPLKAKVIQSRPS